MEASLPREFELGDKQVVDPLRRLFGLVPQSRRRSRFSPASGVPGGHRSAVDRLAAGFSLRFEARGKTSIIEPLFITFSNIRGDAMLYIIVHVPFNSGTGWWLNSQMSLDRKQ